MAGLESGAACGRCLGPFKEGEFAYLLQRGQISLDQGLLDDDAVLEFDIDDGGDGLMLCAWCEADLEEWIDQTAKRRREKEWP